MIIFSQLAVQSNTGFLNSILMLLNHPLLALPSQLLSVVSANSHSTLIFYEITFLNSEL